MQEAVVLFKRSSTSAWKSRWQPMDAPQLYQALAHTNIAGNHAPIMAGRDRCLLACRVDVYVQMPTDTPSRGAHSGEAGQNFFLQVFLFLVPG